MIETRILDEIAVGCDFELLDLLAQLLAAYEPHRGKWDSVKVAVRCRESQCTLSLIMEKQIS